jgi:hypothetical protein
MEITTSPIHPAEVVEAERLFRQAVAAMPYVIVWIAAFYLMRYIITTPDKPAPIQSHGYLHTPSHKRQPSPAPSWGGEETPLRFK